MVKDGILLFFKVMIIVVLLLPIVYVWRQFSTDGFGIEPFKEILHILGNIAILYLLVCAIATIFARVTGFDFFRWVAKILGLFALLFVILHIGIFFITEADSSITYFFSELQKRYYLMIGALSFLILLVLGILSVFFSRFYYLLSPLAMLASFMASIHFVLSNKNLDYFAVGVFLIFFILISLQLIKGRRA